MYGLTPNHLFMQQTGSLTTNVFVANTALEFLCVI